MAKYSPAGYAAALKVRRRATLLVEGREDKEVFARTLHEFCHSRSVLGDNLLIDVADIIDPPPSCVGNRQIVEEVHHTALRLGVDLTSFVDREFREFDLEPAWVDKLLDPPEIAPGLFWSRGHSMENYLLADAYVIQFIRYRLAADVSSAVLNEAIGELPNVRRWLCAFSIAVKNARIINRCDGVLTDNSWVVDASGVIAMDVKAIVHRLVGDRGVERSDAESYLADAVRIFHQLRSVDPNLIALMTHGHHLMDGIWAALALFFEQRGVSHGRAKDLVRDKAERLRYLAQVWARDVVSEAVGCAYPRALWVRLLSRISEQGDCTISQMPTRTFSR
jgi:hypothetical protein